MLEQLSSQSLSRKPQIVTIGGGTGHFALLTGLKEHPVDIVAIVSMADDGGSSGVLRDELGVLPPGDVRQCLAALSRETPTLRALFSYRFAGGPMKGHAFGNLFISALEKITGSFATAVAEAGRILSVHGEVIPVTEGNMRLIIELKDGTHVSGEKFLDGDEHVRTVGVKKVVLQNPVEAHPRAVEKIMNADMVVLGPGDLFGSVLPPLLIPAIARAVKETKASVVYVSNLTNKRGQTDGFTSHHYAHVIHEYLESHRIDTLICNITPPPPHLAERYQEQEGPDMIVSCEENSTSSHPYKVIARDLVSFESPIFHPQDTLNKGRSLIRHDPIKLAAAVLEPIVASTMSVQV